MTRIFLILTGLMWVGYSSYIMLTPQVLAEMAGVVATTATGTVELRAMYGGLQFAVGLLALLAGFSAAWRREGLIALLFIYAGLGLARLASAAVTGEFSTYVIAAVIFELISALITWFLLRREGRSTEARPLSA